MRRVTVELFAGLDESNVNLALVIVGPLNTVVIFVVSRERETRIVLENKSLIVS